jgi:hypothetical protein
MPKKPSSWPKRLLSEVVWIIKPKRYADQAALELAVREYHVAIMKSDERWQPDTRVLSAQKLEVGFECWIGDDQLDVEIELETADPEGWTTLELLFAIQQGIAGYLIANDGALYDHCFFEGLSLGSSKGARPSYSVNFGS